MKFINYLDREINDMKTSLVVFLQQNSKRKRKFNQIMEVLQTTAWKAAHGEEDAVNIRGIDAMKNWIYELTQVFPNMVVNEVDYDEVTFLDIGVRGYLSATSTISEDSCKTTTRHLRNFTEMKY